MVQVVENWAEISGVVVSVDSSDKGSNWRVVTVEPEVVTDVSGYPNLVRAQKPPLRIQCRDLAPERLAAGQRVAGRIRLAGPQDLQVHRDGLREVRGE